MFEINPRTKTFSKSKIFFIKLENFVKYFFFIFVVIINFLFKKKSLYTLDLCSYKDTRFINYLFFSLKKNFLFTYNIDLNIFALIKQVGIKNFLFHCSPNFKNKKKKKLKLLINSKKKFLSNHFSINTDYFSSLNIKSDKIIMPYYLYPRIYNKNYDRISELNKEKKVFKIIFSGSTHKEVYGQFKWTHKDQSPMLNRNQIINFVTKEFNTEIYYLKNNDDFQNAIRSKKNIILSLNEGLVKKTKSKLSNINHLKFISKSMFFITAPGTGMPLCHHIIESIKFGTIPITSYPDLLYPKLDSNLCLSFQTLSELYTVIKKAIMMEQEQIEKKQNNLINFYNTMLSPKSFYKTLVLSNFEKEIIACNDHDSAKIFLENKLHN